MSDIANNPDVSGIKLPPLPADYVPTPSPVTPVVVPVKENHTKGFIFLGIAVVVIIAALLVLF